MHSCNIFNHAFDSFHLLKKLEFAREGDITSWKSLYEKGEGHFKKELLMSISKTKNDSLVPFLEEIIKNECDETLLRTSIFALGQTGSKAAEAILIDYYKFTQSSQIKVEIIKAFEQCGSNSAVPLLRESLFTNSLRNSALTCAALFAKKKYNVKLLKQVVTDTNWVYSGIKENAYFIYYSAEQKDLNLIINNLPETAGDTQKYYLKALTKILDQKGSVALLKSDSILINRAGKSLRHILKGKEPWQNKLHALKSFPTFADSADHALIIGFTTSSNLNLRIEGFKAYRAVFPNKSKTYLLKALKGESDYFVKGKLILLIAKYLPKTGYRLIQNNLDKGTISFKEDLLRALDLYEDLVAKNTLRGFLLAKEKRLVNLAFSILDKKNLLSLKQIKALMTTGHFSVLYNALDWQKTKKKFVKTELLIEAFKKFNSPDHFETQDLILDIIKIKNETLLAAQLEELSFNPGTKSVAKKFNEYFPNSNKSRRLWEDNFPEYLSVDSVLTLPSKNILVEISTNKGEITVELYSKIAPLTVKNFLKLAKKGFYDKLIFHRVIADFVIQGGDPLGDGWGGAGYLIPSEDHLTFERGTIGIATSGFDTGSCQFFICQSEQPHLRGNYTAFGKVINGLDIVDNIQVDDIILSIKPISLN